MNSIEAGQSLVDDFLNPREADAALLEWERWYRSQIAAFGQQAWLPLPGTRREARETSATPVRGRHP